MFEKPDLSEGVSLQPSWAQHLRKSRNLGVGGVELQRNPCTWNEGSQREGSGDMKPESQWDCDGWLFLFCRDTKQNRAKDQNDSGTPSVVYNPEVAKPG